MIDTSETYIKMCEKAEEIRKLWKPKLADFCIFEIGETTITSIWDGADDEYTRSKNHTTADVALYLNYIWLPRQDQLQEMVFAEDLQNGDVGYPLFRISQFENQGGHNCASMEQLWLAFVMHEKYNKVWDGSEWVIENR